jgi:hypothetical protein
MGMSSADHRDVPARSVSAASARSSCASTLAPTRSGQRLYRRDAALLDVASAIVSSASISRGVRRRTISTSDLECGDSRIDCHLTLDVIRQLM